MAHSNRFQKFIGLIFVGVFMTTGFAHAASSQSQSIGYQLTILPSLSVACPTGNVNLGTWETGSSPSGQSVSCSVKQNRSAGTLLIIASPAVDTLSLQEPSSGASYPVQFSGLSFSSGTVSGSPSFASGMSVTNPSSGAASTFSYTATPAANIPQQQHSGQYSGAHSLTFSLI